MTRPCPTCGREVARDAVSCPQCGQRFGPNVGRMVVLAILIFLGFAALMLVLQEVAFNAKLDRLGR